MDREEALLREWKPGWFAFESAPERTDLDDLFLQLFKGTQRNHAVQIQEWAQAFLDLHPVADQRTMEAVKAWADRIEWPDQEYGAEYVALACRIAVTIAIEDQAQDATITAVQDRIYGRQKELAIYDGDLEKARRFYRVDAGWHPILDELVIGLSKIPTAGFFSAGQKWGGLKVAFVCDDDFRQEAEAITEIACQKAEITCEICGEAGVIRKQGWWKVLCDQHQDMRSVKEHLRARFPQLVDRDTKIDIHPEWYKYPHSFLEQVEQLEFDHKLLRIHDVYERGGEIVIDYDSGSVSSASIPPRIALRIRHIAEEIALESKLEGDA